MPVASEGLTLWSLEFLQQSDDTKVSCSQNLPLFGEDLNIQRCNLSTSQVQLLFKAWKSSQTPYTECWFPLGDSKTRTPKKRWIHKPTYEVSWLGFQYHNDI